MRAWDLDLALVVGSIEVEGSPGRQ